MELTLKKQEILQEFTPKPVILFNNDLSNVIYDDFVRNEAILDYRCRNRETETVIYRGGIQHLLFINYRWDVCYSPKNQIEDLSITDIDITCFVNEGKYNGKEVSIQTPFWTLNDMEKLESLIINNYNL